jgi:hypothetical protein
VKRSKSSQSGIRASSQHEMIRRMPHRPVFPQIENLQEQVLDRDDP